MTVLFCNLWQLQDLNLQLVTVDLSRNINPYIDYPVTGRIIFEPFKIQQANVDVIFQLVIAFLF